MTNSIFSGSYSPEDCLFLLKEVSYDRVPAALRAAGQSEQFRDYLPCWEDAPPADHYDLYQSALQVHAERLASEIAVVAHALAQSKQERMVLGSLARAGTPYGILLGRALRLIGIDAVHYSLSLIKGPGVDFAALDYILQRHGDQQFYFIDGWTGKGGIARELEQSVGRYNASRSARFPTQLTVIADLAGVAALAATTEDYLLPSAPINAPMNGLISKTFAHDIEIGAGDFHGALIYRHLADVDRSCEFVDRITAWLPGALQKQLLQPVSPISEQDRQAARKRCVDELARLTKEFGCTNEDLVKHGYCETVRAMQRRPMKAFILRQPGSSANSVLVKVAREAGVQIIADPHLEYECVGLCQQ